MFARRHPFLFFLMILSTCATIVFSGFVVLVSLSSKLFTSQFAHHYDSAEGNIGIVEINGMILSSKKTIQDIKTFHDDDAIKAIILRIDSPGGGIGPSQEIYREIIKIKAWVKSHHYYKIHITPTN